MTEVSTGVQSLERFRPIVGEAQMEVLCGALEELRVQLAGRTWWNINSTAVGGGVAELLRAQLAYARGAGLDARWAVIEGSPDFFALTKRLHHALHGSSGDASPLDGAARATYDEVTSQNAAGLLERIRPRDLVLLHDPQTAGLAPHLIRAGAVVCWRCHIGHDSTNQEVERGWSFLAPYLREVPAFIFSRRAYVPPCCDHGKTTIITPSIDAFSTKNGALDESSAHAILAQAGLVEAVHRNGGPTFTREDGSRGRVERQAEMIRVGDAPAWNEPLVVQVSRWDPLKDPVGVILGFAEFVNGSGHGPHLVMAGPNVRAVADDPEGAAVFDAVEGAWRELPDAVRRRVHLASLPMDDVDENAAIVNALQRHASVIVQKSLQEGFGLTVTEAMWKSRPIVASAVGGIQDQIDDGVQGLLLRDPADRVTFATALRLLLDDPGYARRLGTNAHTRARNQFLSIQELAKCTRLLSRVYGANAGHAWPSAAAAEN